MIHVANRGSSMTHFSVHAALIAIMPMGVTSTHGAVIFHPIALSGTQIPDRPAGTLYGAMAGGASIAPDGSIAFEAKTNLSGTPTAVFSYSPGSGVRTVALDHTLAPPTPGAPA